MLAAESGIAAAVTVLGVPPVVIVLIVMVALMVGGAVYVALAGEEEVKGEGWWRVEEKEDEGSE